MDLSTTYMGLKLKNPLVPSASPLSQKVEDVKRLEDAGAPAVVMFSIFEEQIHRDAEAMDYLMTQGSESFAEALSYFPEPQDFQVGPEQYLDLVAKAVEAVDIPVIGSLNGVSNEGWIDYARKLEATGVKGIELNVYYIPTDPRMTGAHVESLYLDVLKAVKMAVKVPVAIKLSPYFSSMANMAARLDEAGADALVLFNRFYQPDFDLEAMDVEPSLNLSKVEEIRLPLRWIAILFGKVKASMAATTGVRGGQEIAKYLLAGADVAMTTSELLEKGIQRLPAMLDELTAWMKVKGYTSVAEMKGAMSRRKVENPSAFERANYIKIIESYKAKYANV